MQQNEVTWFYSRRPNERISWHENSYQCHYPRHKTSHQSKPYLHTIYCFAKLPFRPPGPATPPPTDPSDPSTEPRKKKKKKKKKMGAFRKRRKRRNRRTPQ